jgi:hypothetical protein
MASEVRTAVAKVEAPKARAQPAEVVVAERQIVYEEGP